MVRKDFEYRAHMFLAMLLTMPFLAMSGALLPVMRL
jgi:hypothetical protein